MRIGNTADYLLLIDALRDKGAASVKITLGSDGSVTGLDVTMRSIPPAFAPPSHAREVDERLKNAGEDKKPMKRPAGLGY